MEATLLVELLTEELPPRSLKELSDVFAAKLYFELQRERFLSDGSSVSAFGTPRRLAAFISRVLDKAPDKLEEQKGPSLKVALDTSGKPTTALLKFAEKNDVSVDSLIQVETPKGTVFACRKMTKGALLDTALWLKVEKALSELPVSKMMRWGSGDAEFVRPVHGLVMMHGARVVPGTVLGVSASSTTHGHRFMSLGPIALANADEYEARLRDDGMVIADFAERRASIVDQLQAEAQRLGATLGDYADLLDEVTALVEHPSVYLGEFDAAFLQVPQECLILTMRQNQKYFPLFDAGGKLLPKFLIVSNMRLDDPRHIVGGNQRVMRPRLEDARFFYDQDRRHRLESRVPELARVVYHNKLGSQLERAQRLQLLAGNIARRLGADHVLAERAAWLAKADLLTGMVGEFPELQGVMGRYYALHDREPSEVADAIEAHYRPRFAGDGLPQSPVACAVALADKLDALSGLFGIGQTPTGDKDPFGLRRAALGVVRIVVERDLDLELSALLDAAFAGHGNRVADARAELASFVLDRMRGYFQDLGYSVNEIEAVLGTGPERIALVPSQLEAVRAFARLPEAASLAAANKRIANILRQAEGKGESFAAADAAALAEPAERALHQALHGAALAAAPLYERGDYTGYLKTFASLKEPVDAFFDGVLVMVEDRKLRANRLALLATLRAAMNRFADISKLAS